MQNGLSFNIKLLDNSLTVNLYDNILENIESIMNINYNEELSLKIIVRNYLGVNSNAEDVEIDIDISNKEKGVILSYYNGILYSISYKNNCTDNVCNNLSIIDIEDNYDITNDRIGLLYMMLDDSALGKEYKGTYKNYSESLIIKSNLHGTEHRYTIEDESVVGSEEMMTASVSVFNKNTNYNKLKHQVKNTGELVDIELVDFIRYLVDILGGHCG